MRILVISDTHGNETALFRVVEAQPTARVVIHLGDGVEEAEAAAAAFPDREFHLIRGNNDWHAGDRIPSARSCCWAAGACFAHTATTTASKWACTTPSAPPGSGRRIFCCSATPTSP